jgi:hypothetical protein
MATTQTKTAAPNVDAAFDQFKEAGEQVIAAARKAGTLYIDSYEKAVDRAIELELEVAGLTQQEWLKGLVDAQAELSREIAGTYVTTARRLLK